MVTSGAHRARSLKFDSDELQYLTTDERFALLAGLESLVGGESAKDFIARVWPDEPPPRHVLPVIDVVQQARVSPVRIYIDMGPGHAKTTTLLRLLIWWLLRAPADQCGYITYSSGQAHDKSRIALEYGADAGLVLATDSKAKGHWHTPHGGGLIAAGAQGKLTGQRIPGLILVDDPYKSELEARSSVVNFAVIERFKGIAFTRLQGGSIIVLHTRYADNDLGGFLLDTLKWDSIHIPTICESEDDAIGRKIIDHATWSALTPEARRGFGIVDPKAKDPRYGEVAWPEKYPYEICSAPCGHDGHLAEIRHTIGEHLWFGMYQGRPRPIGKAIFHEPARYRLHDTMVDGVLQKSDFSWSGKRGVIMADTAASQRTSADWTVLLTLAMSGVGGDSEMWIVDCVRVQEEAPELLELMKRQQRKYRLMIGVETVAGGGGRMVAQMLRRADKKLRIIDVEVGGKDKLTRAIPVSVAWNQGRVYVPIDADWADVFIEEHKKFTGVNDTHDDQVDADAHGWNLMYRGKPKITESDYAGGAGI